MTHELFLLEQVKSELTEDEFNSVPIEVFKKIVFKTETAILVEKKMLNE